MKKVLIPSIGLLLNKVTVLTLKANVKIKYLHIAFIAFTTLLVSCRSNVSEIGWDTDNVLPLARTNIRMADLVELDSAITFDGSGEGRLVLSDTLYSFSNPLDSLVNIKIAPYETSATLSSLEIADQTAVDTIGMQELLAVAGLTLQDSSTLNSFIIGLIPPIDMPDQAVNFSSFLDEAVLLTGFLDLEIDNHLPLILESVTITISNAVGGESLYSNTITDIQPYSSFVQTEDIAASLAGQPIEGDLVISITGVSLGVPAGMTEIPIYFLDYIAFSATVRDLGVSSATAIFPAQDVIDDRSEVPLLELDDMELIYAHIDSGAISVIGYSTLPTPLNMHYVIPSATQELDTFFFDAVIPAADDLLNPTYYEEVFEFFDYDLDLTGEDGSKFNTFVNHTTAAIDSTGEKISLSLNDTLYILIEITKFKPDYIVGFLGQDTIIIGPDGLSTEIDGLDITTIDLEAAMLDIVISNVLGIDGDLIINELSADGLNSSVQGSIHVVSSAIDNITHSTPVISQFSIPDIKDLVNSNPDSLRYELSFELNPGGNVPLHSDFLHNSAELSVVADINVPFSFGNTAFTYTTNHDWNAEGEIPEGVNSGHLLLKADNGLPLEASVTLVFSDSTIGVLDSVSSTESILAATVDGAGLVSESVVSELYFELSQNKIQSLKDANIVMIKVEIEVPDGLGYVTLYADYSLDLTLIGEFNLTVNGE